jgi:pimeloyl-ACP methyl ester carboxylesterase
VIPSRLGVAWRFIAALAFLAGTILPQAPPVAAKAAATPGPCVQGTLPHGARSLICVPATGWNGDVIVWAHGYVGINEPLDFVQLTLPDGTLIPLVVQLLGFAFATTSYRSNGIVILEGIEDVTELIAAFPPTAGRAPNRTYLVGASEGGLIATMLAERSPHLVDGVLAACGPIGDFAAQVQHIGDFRVLFDVYFPGVLPGSPIAIPQVLIDHWADTYVPAVVTGLLTNPAAAVELMRVAGIPFDPAEPTETIILGTLQLLWYSVFATNDARARLGGNPYDNTTRQYRGSADDADLNARVQRFTADPAARIALAFYRTSGAPGIPLVVLHTIGDPVVPAGHALLYRAKSQASGSSRVTLLPVQRWGHCNFTLGEALAGMIQLQAQVGGSAASSDIRSGTSQRRIPSVRNSIEP